MYAEMHDTPARATERVGSRGRERVSTRVRTHAYLRERALPRALGKVWPSAGGCNASKSASRKKFLSSRRIARVRCARASTEPREFAIVLIIIVSGQTVNRFAYVMNNPLSYTDPSGYFSLKKLFRAVVAIVVAYYTGQWVGWHAMAVPGITSAQVGVISGIAGGFAGGLVASGGNLKAALQGALTGGLFGFAGGIGEANSFARYAAHAAAGCVSSVSGGGKCGSGAASAVFGKYTTNWIGDNTNIQGDIAKGIATTVAGGIGSVIAGGKFESGAVTAAYGYLFNEVLSRADGSRMHSEEFEARQNRSAFSGYHRYDSWTQCEGACNPEAVLFQLNVQPAPGTRDGDKTTIFILGTVHHDSDGQGTMNTTETGSHRLAPGRVFRSIENRDGVIGIRSIGIGWGIFPKVNELTARYLWQNQDRGIFERANRCGASKC